MHHHQPRSAVSLRILRMGRAVAVVIMCVGLSADMYAEDFFPPPPPPVEPPVEPPNGAPPVVVPPPIDDAVPFEQIIIPDALIFGNGFAAADQRGDVVEPPDIPPPHAPAKPAAIILRWNSYRTLVVIDTSAGLLKPCWIVTLTTTTEQIPTLRGPIILARGQVVVAYRGQAYHDKDGILHIDARRARLRGTPGIAWSPDSFAITPAKEVSARDDDPTHASNSGEVEKEVYADTQREEYRRLMFTAQSLVEGNL